MAGDVIVKFREGSDYATRVARAMRTEAVPTEIRAVAVRLAADLGVPLEVARVTSGHELVLSIDCGELARALARSAARDPAVSRSSPMAAPRSVLRPSEIAVEVELRRGSEAERQVSAAAQAGGRHTSEVSALVDRLAAGTRPAPAYRIAGRDRLVLTVDVAALTRHLVERIGQRPDVEYAQPSQIVKPFGAVR